jgi:hypothetical protein
MFQVVVQSAIRNLKSKFKLRPPPPAGTTPESHKKDKTGFILWVFLVCAIFLFLVFTNLGL